MESGNWRLTYDILGTNSPKGAKTGAFYLGLFQNNYIKILDTTSVVR